MDRDEILQSRADSAREEWLNDKREEKTERALKFVEHIENHLTEHQVVGCKICGKTIDEIWDQR